MNEQIRRTAFARARRHLRHPTELKTSAQKNKRPVRIASDRPLNLILAVTYVPAQFPAQYHRPGKA